ncbi:Ligand-gated ion channel, partial [Ostertagia ostertagi]
AVLREKEDAHIAAAIQYTVEWLNQRGVYGEVEYLIDYLDDVDHYDALKKACSMFERDRVIALIGGSHSLLNAQLERLTDQHIAFFPRAQLFEAIVDLFRYWRWNRITIVKEMEECRYQARKDCTDALQMGLIDLKHWSYQRWTWISSVNHAIAVSPYPVDGTFLLESKHMFNFTQFQQHVRQKWNTKTANSKNLKMMEAVFTFDAIYTFANTFTDVSAAMMLDDLPLTMCRKPTRNTRRYQHGRTLIDRMLENSLRGLSGDLRRLNGNPGKSNYSLRIQLIGYNGIGFWEPATEVHVNMSGDSRAQLQRNVQVSDELKPHFRVTTIMERPYVMLKKNHYELYGNMKFEGFCIDLLAELSRDLGFTYAIHAVADGKYGNDVYGNGSWDGMIAKYSEGMRDIGNVHGVASDTVRVEPELLVLHGSPASSRYVTSTMLKGGCDFGPRAVSTRLLGGTWWVFTLVIISAYTANLAAVVSLFRGHSSQSKTLTIWLIRQPSRTGTIKGGSTMQFFQAVLQRIVLQVFLHTRPSDPVIGVCAWGISAVWKSLREVGSGKLEMNERSRSLRSTSLNLKVSQNCNLTQIGGVLGSKGYGIALQKKSEWTDRISRQILLYQKRGIIEMKKSKWWRSKGATCTGTSSSVKQQRFSLSLHNVAGLFIILGAGLLFGILTVIVECRQYEKEKISIWTELVNELRFALNLNIIEDHRSRKKNSKLNGAVPPPDFHPRTRTSSHYELTDK